MKRCRHHKTIGECEYTSCVGWSGNYSQPGEQHMLTLLKKFYEGDELRRTLPELTELEIDTLRMLVEQQVVMKDK